VGENGRGGERRGRDGWENEGGEGKGGREGEGRAKGPLTQIPGSAPERRN